MSKQPANYLEMKVFSAVCGQLPVVLGVAPAKDLYEVSFADVLDEAKDEGYQRPIDSQHSREFRAYIERPGATTIPLTFNLRGANGQGWTLGNADSNGAALLTIRRPSPDAPPVLAQVDCQHRLGMMGDSEVPLTFQCFLGLTPTEEMSIFNVINGKAKGLSSSLLDYHTTKLTPDLASVQVDLYIAKMLNDDPESVWHGRSSSEERPRKAARGAFHCAAYRRLRSSCYSAVRSDRVLKYHLSTSIRSSGISGAP